MNRSMIVLGIFVTLLLVAILNMFSGGQPSRPSKHLAYSAFVDQIENHQVVSVRLSGTTITGQLKSGESFTTLVPSVEQVVPTILSKKISLTVVPSEDDLPSLLGVIISWLPFLLYVLALWLFVGRPLSRIEQQLQSLEKSVSAVGKNT